MFYFYDGLGMSLERFRNQKLSLAEQGDTPSSRPGPGPDLVAT